MDKTTIVEDRVTKKGAPGVKALASQAANVWGTLTVAIVGATLIGITLTLAGLSEEIAWGAAISFILIVFCFPVGILGATNLRHGYSRQTDSRLENIRQFLRR